MLTTNTSRKITRFIAHCKHFYVTHPHSKAGSSSARDQVTRPIHPKFAKGDRCASILPPNLVALSKFQLINFCANAKNNFEMAHGKRLVLCSKNESRLDQVLDLSAIHLCLGQFIEVIVFHLHICRRKPANEVPPDLLTCVLIKVVVRKYQIHPRPKGGVNS